MARLGGRERVIVRSPSWLGDFVMAEPLVQALHRQLVEEGSGSASLCGPERLLALFDGRFAGLRRIPLRERADERPELYRGYELALFLNGSWRSAWCALRARVPERVSWGRGGRAVLLTFAAGWPLERGRAPLGIGRKGRWPRPLPRPFGAACAELAGWIGLELRERRPRLTPSATARERARQRLAAHGIDAHEPFVLVNAARRPGSAKGLDGVTWAAILAELTRASPFPVLVHGAPGEVSDARFALALVRCELSFADPAPDLEELLALVAAARCYLTADSGPRHLATATGTPCAVLFGPTDPRHTAEHLERCRGFRVEVPCGPCHLERCPLAGEAQHACMRRIPPAAVGAGVAELALLAASHPDP